MHCPSPAFLLLIPLAAAYNTWCGKHYEQGAPHIPPHPESRFQHPPNSKVPLLDFRCVTASSLYLPDDDVKDPPAIIFDASITRDVGNAYLGTPGSNLSISVYIDSNPLLTGIQVPTGSTGSIHPLPLVSIPPSLTPRTVVCKAEIAGLIYTDTTDLFNLPFNPYGGSTVKLDRRSGGGMMVRNESLKEPVWERLIPFGWYDSINAAERPDTTVDHPFGPPWDTDIDELLYHHHGLNGNEDPIRTNIERLNLAKKLGFNFLHPVPGGPSYAHEGDDTAFRAYMDHAERIGIWVMYDMRHSFSHLSLVEPQIEAFRDRKNLLLWYTADEPDGHENALDSTIRAKELIRSLDPYHPVSLCLNCADYYWTELGSSGADILLVDVYSIALSGGWSKRYNTPVTPDFGASGCDGCLGSFYDLTGKIEEWSKRRHGVGRDRTLPIWIVPQAFNDHGDEFWWRVPTGAEEAVQVVLGINHGVLGHCAWFAGSATVDILKNASMIAQQLYTQTRFIHNAAHTRRTLSTTRANDGANGLDLSAWTITHTSGITETLILAANFNYMGRRDRMVFGVRDLTGEIGEVLFGNVRMGMEGEGELEGLLVFDMPGTSVAGVLIVQGKKEEEEEVISLGGGFPLQLAMGIGKVAAGQ